MLTFSISNSQMIALHSTQLAMLSHLSSIFIITNIDVTKEHDRDNALHLATQ
jgi:hypothetical protein